MVNYIYKKSKTSANLNPYLKLLNVVCTSVFVSYEEKQLWSSDLLVKILLCRMTYSTSTGFLVSKKPGELGTGVDILILMIYPLPSFSLISLNARAHSFGQFKKHALLKACTQSPCFSKYGVGRLFKFWWCQCWLAARFTVLVAGS